MRTDSRTHSRPLPHTTSSCNLTYLSSSFYSSTNPLSTDSSPHNFLYFLSPARTSTSSSAFARYQAPLSAIARSNPHLAFHCINLLPSARRQQRQGQSFQMALFIISWPWVRKAARMVAAMGDSSGGAGLMELDFESKKVERE